MSDIVNNPAIVGDAIIQNGQIRLTPPVYAQAGNVYYNIPAYVTDINNNYIDFSVYMKMSMGGTTSGQHADGLGFIMQSNTTDFGGGGGGIGYGGIPNSIGIMCDNFQNGYDPNNNHMELDVNGVVENSLITATPSFEMWQPDPYVYRYIWIDYKNGIFYIYISESNSKPLTPLITYELDIRNYLILNN